MASEVFSVMCGASSTPMSFSWLATFFGASLMSTTFLPLVDAAAFGFATFAGVLAFSAAGATAATAAVAATAFAALSDFSDLVVLVGLTAGAPRSVSRRRR